MGKDNWLHWIIIYRQYFYSARLMLDNIIDSKNHIILQKPSSDAALFYPLMFTFYHGIELLLKGICHIENKDYGKNNHSLRELTEIVKNTGKYSEIIDEITQYTENLQDNFPEFYMWLKENNFDIDKFYFILKYTAVDNLGSNNVWEADFTGREEELLQRYQEMRATVERLFSKVVGVTRKNSNFYAKNC